MLLVWGHEENVAEISKKQHNYVQQFPRVVMDTWKEDPYEDKSFRGLRKTRNKSRFLLHCLLVVLKRLRRMQQDPYSKQLL